MEITGVPKLRVLRPTNNLERQLAFYRDGLGFDVLDRYEDLNGWDGIVMGHRNWPYQFEFCQPHESGIEHEIPPAHRESHMMVFCITDSGAWTRRLAAMYEAGFTQMTPPPVYGGPRGAMFEDSDGYHVVLVNGYWKK